MALVQSTINCKGKLLDLSQPKIMAIVNMTTDSFYDGGQYLDERKFKKHIVDIIAEGADIIDLGAASSRPGASNISIDLEVERISKGLEWVRSLDSDIILSVDTHQSEVAAQIIDQGVDMINDISGFNFDMKLLKLIEGRSIPYVLMHMKGVPQSMQDNPKYDNVVNEILSFLVEKLKVLQQMDIKDVVIDPGFGFGKTVEHNYDILRELHTFQVLGKPIMIGLSRKSMIYKPLGVTASEALNGTSALHMYALQQGANILRVHDVLAAKEVVRLFQLVNEDHT